MSVRSTGHTTRMNNAAPPSPAEFGLTQHDLAELKRIESAAGDNEAGVSWMGSLFFGKKGPKVEGCLAELVGGLLFWTVLWPFFLIGLLLTPLVQAIARLRLRSHRRYREFQAYKNALLQHEKSKRDFWVTLTGPSFERHIAELYRLLGYSATVTPGSGDEGVDIVLTGGGKRVIVQCKQHCKPVGPAIVRELYGALAATGADSAILACTSGFTPGVFDFARDKPIELVDLDAILRMQETASQGRTDARL